MKIKYLPTGNIFDLPEEECKRIWTESPFNYEILDGAFKAPAETEKSTVAKKVLAETEKDETKPNKNMSFEQLKGIALKKGIPETMLVAENGKNITKAELLKLIDEYEPETEKDETTTNDEE